MALVQLDFFEPDNMSELKARMEKCEASSDRVRKKLFAENGALKKRIAELESQVNILTRNICQGASHGQ